MPVSYEGVKIQTKPMPDSEDIAMTAIIPAGHIIGQQAAWEIIREVVRLVAERYVQENYPELVAKIDQQAIANLAIAESGKKIAEEIRSKPTVIHDKEVRTEVFQKSIFGGLKRV